MVGILFAGLFGLPQNAYAECINNIQSQAIAAAYEGDEIPTVHEMDTCSGDDISYQIPIATTITFDGVQYSNIYATTNSVITFGQPDGTYWDYPSTPSISLYSMDWFPGYGGQTEGLDIYYSEGGFQINLNMVPFGNWSAEPSTVNILVAITSEGGISVAYSYQGPEYQNLRTGVRLHDGSIVSLEEWGATQIDPGQPMPTLAPEPVSESEPLTPEEQQTQVVEAQQLANEISELNNLIVSINNEEEVEPEVMPEPETTPSEEPEKDPDVIVEPEIITPEDPRFPDGTDEQNEQDPSTNPEDSEIVEEPSENEEPVIEPQSPSEDTDQSSTDEQENYEPSENPVQNQDNNSSNNSSTAIAEEELKELNKIISENDAKLLAQLITTNEAVAQAVVEFTERAEENADSPMPYTIADAITEVQTEKLLEDPVGTFTSMFTEIDTEVLLSPSEWGKDMTDDQREKVQEIVVSVIIASNLISASINRRIG